MWMIADSRGLKSMATILAEPMALGWGGMYSCVWHGVGIAVECIHGYERSSRWIGGGIGGVCTCVDGASYFTS